MELVGVRAGDEGRGEREGLVAKIGKDKLLKDWAADVGSAEVKRGSARDETRAARLGDGNSGWTGSFGSEELSGGSWNAGGEIE